MVLVERRQDIRGPACPSSSSGACWNKITETVLRFIRMLELIEYALKLELIPCTKLTGTQSMVRKFCGLVFSQIFR